MTLKLDEMLFGSDLASYPFPEKSFSAHQPWDLALIESDFCCQNHCFQVFVVGNMITKPW